MSKKEEEGDPIIILTAAFMSGLIIGLVVAEMMCLR
jgi:hypothetical protein